MSIRHAIYRSETCVVNDDPQRRCYNGCNFSEAIVQGPWEEFDSACTNEKAEERLKFWTDLADYAARTRGDGARTRYKIVEVPMTLST